MSFEGLVIEDRYELRERLGGGAFGETWAAVDRQSDAEVVCKLVAVRGMPTWKPMELFEREAAVLRTVRHPDVPRFFGAYETHLRPGELTLVLVMERVHGETLLSLISRRERWDEARARHVLERLLSLLDHLHGLSPPVIHRDIKPANVMLRENGDPVLVDYGAVRDLGARADHGSLTVVGTAGYMPPEQAMGVALPASDLFALGATMIHALTHTHPADLPRKGMRIQFDGLVGCSPALAAVLARLAEPDVERRYARAADALADLRRPPEALVLRPKPDGALTRPPPLSLELPSAPRSLRPAAAARIETIATSKATQVSGGGLVGGLVLAAWFGSLGGLMPAYGLLGAGVAWAVLTWGPVSRSTRRRFRSIYEEGTAVKGRVLGIKRERSGGRTYAEVEYTYQVAGRSFVGLLQHSDDAAIVVRHDDPLLITCDPQRPDLHVAAVTLPEDVVQRRLAGDE